MQTVCANASRETVFDMANYLFNDPNTVDRGSSGEPATLTGRIYDVLREAVTSGALPPGCRLVRRTLSAKLGVSPIPVSEALVRLEMDGLVESKPLCGSRVRVLTIDDVENDQMLREALECHAARLCAERATEAQLTRLKQRAKPLDRLIAEGDPQSQLGMQTHLEFHLTIAEYSGFSRLAQELERVWQRRLMRLNWLNATVGSPVPPNWHERLSSALAARDPDHAERAMREHVRHGIQHDLEQLNDFLNQEQSSKHPTDPLDSITSLAAPANS